MSHCSLNDPDNYDESNLTFFEDVGLILMKLSMEFLITKKVKVLLSDSQPLVCEIGQAGTSKLEKTY